MSVKNIIGAVILLSIFIGALACVIKEIGWGEFLAFIGLCAVMFAVLVSAIWCLVT